MTGCEAYGMNNGCDVDCPVLLAHGCELMHDENKQLYYAAMYGMDVSTWKRLVEKDSYELARGSNIR